MQMHEQLFGGAGAQRWVGGGPLSVLGLLPSIQPPLVYRIRPTTPQTHTHTRSPHSGLSLSSSTTTTTTTTTPEGIALHWARERLQSDPTRAAETWAFLRAVTAAAAGGGVPLPGGW